MVKPLDAEEYIDSFSKGLLDVLSEEMYENMLGWDFEEPMIRGRESNIENRVSKFYQ